MSLCYHMVCRDCRKDVWVGQDRQLYRTVEALDSMTAFLHAHYMHTLAFMETNDLSDLKEVWFVATD